MDDEKKELFPIRTVSINGKTLKSLAETKKLRKKLGPTNKPDDMTEPNWQQLQNPKAGIHTMIAYMMAAGATNRAIAETVDYSEERISTLRNSESMILEIRKIQDQYFGKDIQQKFKQILPRAVKIAEEIMEDEAVKPAIRLQAAWNFMDRSVGRPQQTIEVGGSLLRSIFEKLDKMEVSKIIDISETKEQDPIDEWVNKHI